MIGEPTIADAILDRIIHNAHRIEIKGDSIDLTRQPEKEIIQNETIRPGHQPP